MSNRLRKHAKRHEDGGLDPIAGWIRPSHIGPYSDAYTRLWFRTKNIAGDTPVVHAFAPSDDLKGILGHSSYRWMSAYIRYLYSVENISFPCNTTLYFPDGIACHAYLQPLDAGYGYIGTATRYFYEMHATDFVPHSMKAIKDAVEKLKAIRVENKATFPAECLRKPSRQEVKESMRRRKLFEIIKHSMETDEPLTKEDVPPGAYEPKEAEIDAVLSNPDVTGVKLGQTVALLIEANKELLTRVEELEKRVGHG